MTKFLLTNPLETVGDALTNWRLKNESGVEDGLSDGKNYIRIDGAADSQRYLAIRPMVVSTDGIGNDIELLYKLSVFNRNPIDSIDLENAYPALTRIATKHSSRRVGGDLRQTITFVEGSDDATRLAVLQDAVTAIVGALSVSFPDAKINGEVLVPQLVERLAIDLYGALESEDTEDEEGDGWDDESEEDDEPKGEASPLENFAS